MTSTQISSGTITLPATHIDIALPTGSIKFNLELVGWKSSEYGLPSDLALVGAFSQDNGATFLHDYDGGWVSHRTRGIIANGGSLGANTFEDAALSFNGSGAGSGFSKHFVISIYPGAYDEAASISSECLQATGGVAPITITHSICKVNTCRANLLRLKPYSGDFELNPDKLIEAGSWVVSV